MKHQKAFTLTELIVSFALLSILSLALFRTVLSIQRIQKQNIYINEFKALTVVLNNEIQNDFNNDKITNVTECGNNCYNIMYEKKGNVRLSIDKEDNVITYGNIKEKLPNDYTMYDDIKIKQYTSNTGGFNSYIALTIPIKSALDSNMSGLKYMYIYDSTGGYELDIPNKDGGIYTVRRKIDSNSTKWERLDDNKGLIANATKDGSSVKNDFDEIYPWGDIISYNYDRTTGRETARYGDANFKFDGSNGEVLTKIPSFYYKRYQENGYEYISITKNQIEGYTRSPEFSVGRYESSYDGTNIHSISGRFPEILKNITWFRTESRKVGINFGQLDYHYFILQMLYLVEYANYDSQSALGIGNAYYRRFGGDKALVEEANTNKIVLLNGEYFVVNQYVDITTTEWGDADIAKGRRILEITDYNENGVTGKEITFDGEPVNITLNTMIRTSVQKSGECDVLGMNSGTLHSDGKHAVIYRGIENIYGNEYKFIDGINIKDRTIYINYNPATYQVDKFDGDYKQVGYTTSNVNGYGTLLGYDPNHPLINFPLGVTSNISLSITKDYYDQLDGNRILIYGGPYNGYENVGIFWMNYNNSSGAASIYLGSRLLRY